MTFLVPISLFGWIPAVLAFFVTLSPRRAVLAAFLGAWLLLPNTGYEIPGLPDYTKMSATSLGVILGTVLFQSGRFVTLRPRLLDLPMVVWCVCPVASSLANGLGLYDGLSTALQQIVTWGLPYLVGRLYFADLQGLQELALGIVIGGLIYVPLCWFEIRMSPQLYNWIYLGRYGGIGEVVYGGYRPRVFMTNGLELGMWMTASTLIAFWLWACGTLERVGTLRFGWLLLLLSATTILCKSTGALTLLMLGIFLLYSIKWTGWPIFVIMLMFALPLYMSTRSTGIWSGSEAVNLVTTFVNARRAESFKFRLDNEDILVVKALQRPIFGWGGWGRARVYDAEGKDVSITDGFWVIALGNHGLVGLAAFNAVMLMPLAVLLRRYPVRRWLHPEVAPAAVLAVLVALYAIDCLMNAMINPIYTLIVGGLTALRNRRAGVRIDPRDGSDAEEESIGSLDSTSQDPWHADEGEPILREAVKFQKQRAMEHPELSNLRRDLALSYDALGAFLKDHGRTREAQAAWSHALELWAALTIEHLDRIEYRNGLADSQNNLAWLLANNLDVEDRNLLLAVRLAQSAVDNFPEQSVYWNTLGAAHYRAGAWPAAIAAIERSVELTSGGSSFDDLLMAMIYWRRGETGRARRWYNRAASRMHECPQTRIDLLLLHHEAAVLICHHSSDVRVEVQDHRD